MVGQTTLGVRMLLIPALLMLHDLSTPSATRLLEESWRQTQVVGHRGAAAYAPENTLEAFRVAIATGVPAVELDIHLDADGGMVVIHDATLDRTTTGRGRVREHTTEQIRALGVPYLEEFTALTKDRVVIVIEIKDGEGAERKMVDHLRERDMMDQAIMFSFGADRVARTKELAPELKSVWLYAGRPTEDRLEAMFERLSEIKADAVGFSYQAVTPEAVAESQRRGYPVFVWTVPPGPEVDRLLRMKVNFIITDHPRDVLAQLRGD